MNLSVILTSGEGSFRDRGSKFLAFAHPVSSIEEAEEILGGIKKKYHDARHHCYAYRLGFEGETSFASDDREPAHSAGDPILGQIRAANLTNVVVVVIRYFGGTKLGIRGLIEAYRSAASDALSQPKTKELIPVENISILFLYEQTADVNRILHKFPVRVTEADYTDVCRQNLEIEKEMADDLIRDLDLSGIKIEVIQN